MKLLSVLFMVVVAFAWIGCSDPVDSNAGTGRIIVEVFDTPPPEGIEHLYLPVIQVSVHNDDDGWIIVSEPDTVIDFLELVNGTVLEIADDSIPAGHYSQLRLLLADSATIVIEGVTYPMSVPSGTQTGVKINLDFDLGDRELVEVYVDFDVSKAVVVHNDSFSLKPTFRAFKNIVSVMVSGSVSDTLRVGIGNALVEAMSLDYNTGTLSDSTGAYKLILPEGTYSFSASAAGYAIADTTYTDVVVTPAVPEMTGFDFVLQ